LSAVAGAKLVFLFGEYGWPFRPVDDWGAILYSGRSIVGALIFGLLGAEITKPFVRYSLPPNDRFAALLPFTFAVGRIGCLMSGCCRGIPTDGTLAIVCEDGIRRHPVQLYEIAFHVIAGTIGIWLVRHKRLSGRVFTLFLLAYGLFRVVTETIRETPQSFGGLTAYQWLSLVMIGLGGGFFIKRTLFPSETWRHRFAGSSISAADSTSPETNTILVPVIGSSKHVAG
jgi:prolipoprotein diacylglyceryltransferase